MNHANLIDRHINKSTKQQTEQKTKKSLIDNLSKGLLELEFKQNNQIKIKCLKWIVKNILPNYKLQKCAFIVKSVKNIQAIHFQKNLF